MPRARARPQDVIKAGLLTQEQLDADLALFETDEYAMPSPLMWSVAGRKP